MIQEIVTFHSRFSFSTSFCKIWLKVYTLYDVFVIQVFLGCWNVPTLFRMILIYLARFKFKTTSTLSSISLFTTKLTDLPEYGWGRKRFRNCDLARNLIAINKLCLTEVSQTSMHFEIIYNLPLCLDWKIRENFCFCFLGRGTSLPGLRCSETRDV